MVVSVALISSSDRRAATEAACAAALRHWAWARSWSAVETVPPSKSFSLRSHSALASSSCDFARVIWARASSRLADAARASSFTSTSPLLTTEPRSTCTDTTLPVGASRHVRVLVGRQRTGEREEARNLRLAHLHRVRLHRGLGRRGLLRRALRLRRIPSRATTAAQRQHQPARHQHLPHWRLALLSLPMKLLHTRAPVRLSSLQEGGFPRPEIS